MDRAVGRRAEADVGRGQLPATLTGLEAPPARHSWLRWTPVAALGGAAVFLLVSVVGSALPARPTPALDVAGVAALTTAAPHTTARPTPTPTPTPTATPTSTAPPNPLAMTDAQREKTRAELVQLSSRLPTGVALTAPAAWAKWAGATPSYARDIDGCPHIAAQLARSLGKGKWTYVFGTLPQGGCTWVPVPWIPNQPTPQRFFVTVEFEQGAVPALLHRPTYCAGGDVAPALDVPDLASGAVLSGCDDANGPDFQLAMPDARGTGVWFLGATSGVEQTRYAPEEGLLALVGAARTAYA
jgi:hypothetical protein